MKYILYFLKIGLIFPMLANAGVIGANSDLKLAKVTPVSQNKLHLENVIRNGKVWNIDFVRIPGTSTYKEVLSSKKVNSCFQKAPIEQQSVNKYGNAEIVSPPLGYKGIIGWIAAVNNGSQPGQVKVRSLNIYAIDPITKNRTLLDLDSKWACWDNYNTGMCWRALGGAGFIMERKDWQCPDGKCWDLKQEYSASYDYGSLDGKADPIDYANYTDANNPSSLGHQIVKVESNYMTSVLPSSDATVVFPTSTYPTKVFHAWNTRWPVAEALPNKQYEVVAEVLIEGAGMIQVGYDFLQKRNSNRAGHIQGAISSWECSSTAGNWIKIKAGLPFSINYAD